MAVFVVGVIGIVLFYLIILGLGLWAARRRKEGEEEAMLAGRSIGMIVGTFTMTGIVLTRALNRLCAATPFCATKHDGRCSPRTFSMSAKAYMSRTGQPCPLQGRIQILSFYFLSPL